MLSMQLPLPHPYPIRRFDRFPRYLNLWFGLIGVAVAALFYSDSHWSIALGIAIGWLGAWWQRSRNRCPECQNRLEDRWQLDRYDHDHLFLDCHVCGITFDPEYSHPPEGSSDTSSDEL